MFHFIFPSGIDDRIPFPMFQDQASALKEQGFTTSAFPERVLNGKHDIPVIPVNSNVVYRGWMLSCSQYENLNVAILARDAKPFVPGKEYQLAHHMPNWYPFIKDLTPETRFFREEEDFEAALAGVKGRFFVKDHVKSIKEESFADDASQIKGIVQKIRESRGRIEGGVCVRHVETFVPGSEVRFFVIDGIPFSPCGGSQIPDVVMTCVKRIPSRFYSVDVVEREDGSKRIIEIGDGQVSDLVGWDPKRFAEIWKDRQHGYN